MGEQQPMIVQVQQVNRGCGCGGCLTFIVVLAVLGLAIEYWYIALGIAVVAGLVGLMMWANRDAGEEQTEEGSAKSRGELWASQTNTAVIDLCGACGAQIDGAFCGSCGAPRNQRCSGCGQALTSRFCPNCGTAANS